MGPAPQAGLPLKAPEILIEIGEAVNPLAVLY
jgi:hypothetical protein